MMDDEQWTMKILQVFGLRLRSPFGLSVRLRVKSEETVNITFY